MAWTRAKINHPNASRRHCRRWAVILRSLHIGLGWKGRWQGSKMSTQPLITDADARDNSTTNKINHNVEVRRIFGVGGSPWSYAVSPPPWHPRLTRPPIHLAPEPPPPLTLYFIGNNR